MRVRGRSISKTDSKVKETAIIMYLMYPRFDIDLVKPFECLLKEQALQLYADESRTRF
jgi:hypothetical protein